MIQKFVSKLSKQEKLIFYVTLGFVLVAFLDRLFLGPTINALSKIDEGILRQEISIKGDLKILSYKDKILKKAEAFSKYFPGSIPDDDVVYANFLRKIERLATQSKVSLVKSNPGDKENYRDYIHYYANLDCAGDLKDMITFIHLINSTEDLLKVVKLSMTPKRDSKTEVTASMSIVKLMMSPSLGEASDSEASVK